jgi:hypothetical protein
LRQIADLEFFLRMALYGEFRRIPQTLAAFRKHPGSTTYRSVTCERCDEPMKVVSLFFGRSDLPAEVYTWSRRAYASALQLSAIMHAQSGRLGKATVRFGAALTAHPAALGSRLCLAAAVAIIRAIRTSRHE